tara:strand:+ start:799 stop:1092 length:294 start_codon:yes stop_codon:yes gene_type:complete
MASARVKIGHIAGRRGISMLNAKRYYYDKLDANARGESLPFHKWRKANLSFSNAEGDTNGDKKEGFLKKMWAGKGGKAIIIGGGAVVAYMLWKKFGK